MTIEKIVARMAVTAGAFEPAWLAKATAAVKATGAAKLIKAYRGQVDGDDEYEANGDEANFAVYQLTGGAALLTSAHLGVLQAMLKANTLAIEIGTYQGKLYALISDDPDSFWISSLEDYLNYP